MTRSSSPHAVVVGGSLGGLLAATTLRAADWSVDVFERSPSTLDSRGGGIVLQPDVLAAFRFAGVAQGEALGVRSGDRVYLDASDRVVHRTFIPQTQTSWNLLHGAMHAALPPGTVHAGERLVSFRETGGRVTALFDSGRVESADLLVGADGSRSTVRGQLLPGHDPRYAGYVAWRGLVPESKVSASVAARLGNAFVFQQGPDHLLLEYLVPGEDGSLAEGQRRRNWVWYRRLDREGLARLLTARDGSTHALALPPGMAKEGDVAALRRDAQALLAPSLQALVLATEAPFVQAIVDLGVPRMRFGATVLIGDAAFVPRPHTAGSTAKAAANALSLAQALRQGVRPTDDSLAPWEEGQLALGRAMGAAGIGMGNRIMGLRP
ncbi:FAD binding domain-containing protein [Variovorax arabinosiphilus]|uniref:FAD binding domain-containing protein n=1 Tax=Variovorax arabinosiphilus TaxID=3053498 RepID=UPI002577630E|nr:MULTISPECIES: FAD binding domain-containing protein [unclassified Variovorax]MDM0119735.1 FAD binding domain-containing protein [Variovorax sp. J2L1-78]MDM0128353.1 FAD binding domain-containing protein [Variovorax sp. J2L1-63]MDM0232053.1 FAD binding domain-containing protein [Variovorax sp. J2R1-6]